MSREKTPPAHLFVGMSPEERGKTLEAWRNLTWLTDPLRKNLESRIQQLENSLVTLTLGPLGRELPNRLEQSMAEAAEIRALQEMLRWIP